MKNPPEGPRRLCVAIGLLLVAAWVFFAAFSSNGFKEMIHWEQWAFLFIGVPVLYWMPAFIYRTYRWVRDGFPANYPQEGEGPRSGKDRTE